MTDKHNHLPQRPLLRSEYLQIVRTGLATRQFSFARQAILNWLATYPGDLQAGLFYAQALVGERHFSRAIQVLQGLCYADPEFRDAVEAFLNVVERIKQDRMEALGSDTSQNTGRDWKDGPAQIEVIESTVRAHWFALNGSGSEGEQSASWGGLLWFARQALEQGDMRLADELIEEVLGQGPAHPLQALYICGY